jgi:hypothetical protein
MSSTGVFTPYDPLEFAFYINGLFVGDVMMIANADLDRMPARGGVAGRDVMFQAIEGWGDPARWKLTENVGRPPYMTHIEKLS